MTLHYCYRWKRDRSGNKITHPISGKNILQFVAIKRKDCGEWAIPGVSIKIKSNQCCKFFLVALFTTRLLCMDLFYFIYSPFLPNDSFAMKYHCQWQMQDNTTKLLESESNSKTFGKEHGLWSQTRACVLTFAL